MSSFLVHPGQCAVPAICVACGSPAPQPVGASDPKTMLTVRDVDEVSRIRFTSSRSFPLCPECQAARARSPGLTKPGCLIPLLLFIGSVVAANVFRGQDETNPVWMWVAFAAVLSPLVFVPIFRWRVNRRNPFIEDDRRRLALIKKAVRLEQQVKPSRSLFAGPTLTGVRLTFANETFALAFQALNPFAVLGVEK
ncbi:hypothetical protein E3T33_04610 [Cryobacterium sp. TMT1-2-1]|uniref:hypothetical protein n=1 Tax=Cryobacterium sp. TMT1-2-1 TaxID=1259232 RepID=UPI00106A09C9|nr:hypothetical protein [Cryobacterium sp. TMT1-2-1]TFD46621.1 hypothetical protein E3T33_04610 [Cryobacterium sp. TMT1-2-1]